MLYSPFFIAYKFNALHMFYFWLTENVCGYCEKTRNIEGEKINWLWYSFYYLEATGFVLVCTFFIENKISFNFINNFFVTVKQLRINLKQCRNL